LAQAPAPTNTTDFVPADDVPGVFQKGDPNNPAVFVTPPPIGGQYHDYLVIGPNDVNTLPQNEVAVFFQNGVPVFVQNLPAPFKGNPDPKAPQNSNCLDGKETGAEICDFGLNKCCDVKSFCSKFLPIGNPCTAPGNIPQTVANRRCFTDSCQAVAGSTNGATTCVRTLKSAVVRSTKKPNIAVNYTQCYKVGQVRRSEKRLNTRGLSKRRKAQLRKRLNRLKRQKPKNLDANSVYCDGNGLCPCSNQGCPSTIVAQ